MNVTVFGATGAVGSLTVTAAQVDDRTFVRGAPTISN
jgi:uncharacterized protein YbjT (DUF2867 family)